MEKTLVFDIFPLVHGEMTTPLCQTIAVDFPEYPTVPEFDEALQRVIDSEDGVEQCWLDDGKRIEVDPASVIVREFAFEHGLTITFQFKKNPEWAPLGCIAHVYEDRAE